MTPFLALIILAVVGLLIYVLATNAKAQEAGRLLFACALLGLCLNFSRVLAGLR